MIAAGIDAGSRAIKIVLFDSARNEIIAMGVTDQGIEQDLLTQKLFNSLVLEHRVPREQILRIVATGSSRNTVSGAHDTITEISCHARGTRYFFPEARTIIEVGGQDSKVLMLNSNGRVKDFIMNDRCAAGTGRFLEVLAGRIGVDLKTLDIMSLDSKSPAAISSMCIVFAETEIIGLLAAGTDPVDIAAGVQISLVRRLSSMVTKQLDPPVVFTGGCALMQGVARRLEEIFQVAVHIPPHPHMTGALGAALFAAKQACD